MAWEAVGPAAGPRRQPGSTAGAPPRRPARCPPSRAPLGSLDGAVRLQAARPGLDPVVVDRGLGLARAPRSGRRWRREAARRRIERRPRPGLRQPCGAYARCRGPAHLERLAVRPEGGAQTAGAEQGERDRRARASGRGRSAARPSPPRPPRRRRRWDAAPGRRARDGWPVPAPPSPRTRRRTRRAPPPHRVQPPAQRRRRRGRAQVCDAGQVGVVEVEHVPRRGRRGHRVVERSAPPAPRAPPPRGPRRRASRAAPCGSAGQPPPPTRRVAA